MLSEDSQEKIVCEYLEKWEANDLIALLRQISIKSYSKIMNASTKRVGTLHYIIINSKDLERALPIIEKFKNELRIEFNIKKKKCPKCHSIPPVTYEQNKLTWLKRIWTIGSSVMRCSKCRNEWYI